MPGVVHLCVHSLVTTSSGYVSEVLDMEDIRLSDYFRLNRMQFCCRASSKKLATVMMKGGRMAAQICSFIRELTFPAIIFLSLAFCCQ